MAKKMQVTLSSRGIFSELSDRTTHKKTLTNFSIPFIQT